MNPLGDYIDGAFQLPTDPDGALYSVSPADLSDRLGDFPWAVTSVDAAVEAARRAQPAWAALPLTERVLALRRLQAELKARGAILAEFIAREIGKPLWEAHTEVAAVLGKLDITIDEGLALVRDHPVPGVGEWRFRPHGVLGIIGPFNFPLHLPNGHVVPALLTGNTVVLKPSEIAPASAQLYAEAVQAAGLPRGVFNLVQGDRPAGQRLSTHRGIDGLLFTGSYAVGTAIARDNADQPGKILALEMGGKNPTIVLADADLDKALYDVLFGAYVTTGQRCSATSRAIVERPVFEAFASRMVGLTRGLRIGHPLRPDVFMGPLASRGGRQRFLEACARAPEQGAETLLAPAPFRAEKEGYYVSPGLHRVRERRKDSTYQRLELFGPDLALYEAGSPEEALEIANDSDYGLCAGVFTRDRAKLEWLATHLEAGVIQWNASTAGTSSRLPFGGLKRSGNHRPAGVFSSLYCAYPVAIGQGKPSLDPAGLAPGVSWDRR